MEMLGAVRRPAVCVHPAASLVDVSTLMAARGVGVVVVTEDGRVRGIVSGRDVVTRAIAEGRDPATTPVATVMTAAVQTVRDGLCPGEAAALAHEGRFRHVPVVDPAGRVVGLLSIRDLLSGYAAELEVKNSELLACLSADGAGGD